MISDINILTSGSKVSIVELLRTPKTPDDIAGILNITRQGVDKQLKELMRYGIVDRKWFIGYSRPKIEYFLTELGSEFYSSLREIEKRFKESGKAMLNEKLKNLDIDLMDGRLSVEKYTEEKMILEDSMEWFFSTED
ncbi:MAG: winged helix-turn-helix domain-containing protein [Candidatus Thermoplasmatota archaeon]|nr:winged helix-turn-helix domain-containing protein [Candidatus Thermoplasmatota archaeon]